MKVTKSIAIEVSDQEVLAAFGIKGCDYLKVQYRDGKDVAIVTIPVGDFLGIVFNMTESEEKRRRALEGQ